MQQGSWQYLGLPEQEMDKIRLEENREDYFIFKIQIYSPFPIHSSHFTSKHKPADADAQIQRGLPFPPSSNFFTESLGSGSACSADVLEATGLPLL